MTRIDRYGNVITTTSDAARDAYDDGVALFLGGHFAAQAAFKDATRADPGFALAHVGHARAAMMGGAMELARASLATAQSLSAGITARETQHIAAFTLLLSGKTVAARTHVLSHVQTYPRDAMAAQLCSNVFGLIGFSGKVGREADLLAYTSALLPHYGNDWWMMSMHALSLCETGQVAASLVLMERALALNPDNANGAHFKAHAQYEVGETEAGRAYLDGWMQGYDPRSVLHGHLSWHSALWALQSGDADAFWQAVDTGVGPEGSQGLPINVLTDTAAILHRAEIAGLAVDPSRWKTLSAYAAKTFPDPGQSFADMHAALAHAMAGEGALLAKIAETSTGFAADLVRPVARAWGAMARGAWQDALDALVPVLASTERLGGSRAQRDLIELSHVTVLMRLGKSDEAKRAIMTRRPVIASQIPLTPIA